MKQPGAHGVPGRGEHLHGQVLQQEVTPPIACPSGTERKLGRNMFQKFRPRLQHALWKLGPCAQVLVCTAGDNLPNKSCSELLQGFARIELAKHEKKKDPGGPNREAGVKTAELQYSRHHP